MLLLITFLILQNNNRVWNGNLFPSDMRIDPSFYWYTGTQSFRARWRWHQPCCRVLHLLYLLQCHDLGFLLTALPRIEKGTGALPFTRCLTPYELLFEILVSECLWYAFFLYQKFCWSFRCPVFLVVSWNWQFLCFNLRVDAIQRFELVFIRSWVDQSSVVRQELLPHWHYFLVLDRACCFLTQVLSWGLLAYILINRCVASFDSLDHLSMQDIAVI